MSEKGIVYESGDYRVLRTKSGTYEVYKTGICASTRCAVIGYTGSKGYDRAVAEVTRRERAVVG